MAGADSESVPPHLESEVGERDERIDSGVVDQDVYRSQGRAHLRLQLGDPSRVRDIDNEGPRRATGLGDGGNGVCSVLEVNDRDGGTLCGQPEGKGLPDALSCSGHDSDVTVQPASHDTTSSVRASALPSTQLMCCTNRAILQPCWVRTTWLS